ncbi:MAG: hypothetical protein AAF514_21955 [Verrucomicrobiota bacterium]
MAKPYVHACSSARRFGGIPEDYLPIHNHLDATKGVVADNRHRAATHNAWYIGPDGPLETRFGTTLTNSDNKTITTRAVAEQHILEDFGGFIPTLQDFITAMELQPWMIGQGRPPSLQRPSNRKTTKGTPNSVNP